jgi:uncharacterized membrane protein
MWSLVVIGALFFVGLLIAAPLGQANGFHWFSFAVYQAFSYVCHQSPDRSFYVAGYPLAVCARCTGLYAGFAATVVVYPVLTSLKRTHAPERMWLFIAAAPLAVDFALGFLGIWENSHASRLVTGALLGAVSVFFILPGLVQLSLYQRLFGPGSSKPSEHKPARPNGLSEHVSAPSDYSSPLRRI